MAAIDFLKNQEVKSFIRDHINDDINKLLLNPPVEFKNHIREIANQVLSRQKLKTKLPDWHSNYDLILPAPTSIEQSSSIETASYKKKLISGDHLVDLTGGMGIDCLTLSAKFKKSTYVEIEPSIGEAFQHNAKIFRVDTEIKQCSAEKYLDDFEGKAFFYLDPSRRDKLKNKVIRLEDCSPNLLELLPLLKEKAKKVLVKLSPILDIAHLVEEINYIEEVHVVSVKNDCKELLLLLDFNYNSEPTIKSVNLLTGQPEFTITRAEEENFISELGKLATYLYEPNASILKAGAFKSVGKRFDLNKLSINTHLYTSHDVKNSFPGKIFKVIDLDAKKNLSDYAENGHINVITRNYPLAAQQLKKKFKIKDGGIYSLIGFRDQAEKPQLVIAKRLETGNEP